MSQEKRDKGKNWSLQGENPFVIFPGGRMEREEIRWSCGCPLVGGAV